MGRAYIKTVKDFIKNVPKPQQDQLDVPDSSKKLLQIIYEKSGNLKIPKTYNSIKPPLIISFHPKMSLLNNNVHETYLAEKLAAKFGMVPLWIPYVYDTGYKTAANKIRLPTYIFFEGKYISLRASSKIRGNITATEKPLSEKEIKLFFQELGKHEISILTQLKNTLNPFNFGHYLFDLKRNISNNSKKTIRKKNLEFEKKWMDATKDSKNLAESLAKISISNLNDFGIHVGLLMMDEVLQELTKKVFSEVLHTKSVKKDPSLLENLFLAYNLKTKERSQIMYAGNDNFIAFDDYDVKTFDGTFEDLVHGLGDHSVLPTGFLIMTLFTALGCKLVIGGTHTIEYYPDYFEKSYSLLKETSFNSKMTLLSYGNSRFMDLRNMYDVMSVIRILDKVASRNYIQKGHFELPADIVDHLNFLSGLDAVPLEFKDLLNEIKDKTLERAGNKEFESEILSAFEKEKARCQEIEKLLEIKPEELLKDPSTLKKWIKGTNFQDLHPIRLEVMMENLRLDADKRFRKLEENINYEQHILGGTIGKEEEEGIIYNGIINRSNRYPSLFEMVYYNSKPSNRFFVPGKFSEHESEWIWKSFNQQETNSKSYKSQIFNNYESVFKFLIPKEYLIPELKGK